MLSLGLDSTVRRNILEDPNYTPYCGGCRIAPHTVKRLDGQYRCLACGWVSKFPEEFIAKRKQAICCHTCEYSCPGCLEIVGECSLEDKWEKNKAMDIIQRLTTYYEPGETRPEALLKIKAAKDLLKERGL